MDPLTLPLDYAAIEKILPHRYPFLLVDRITEFEVDRRIVGIKNISSNERYLTQSVDHPDGGDRPGRRHPDSGQAGKQPAAALLRRH